MKLNIKVVFDRRKTASKDREGTIEIYVSQGRKKKYINTGVRVLPKNFKNGMVYGRADAITLNDIIAEKVHQVQSLPFDRVSVDTIDRIHTGVIPFCDWLDEQVEKHNVRESTKRQHRVMARAVRDSKLFKSFDDITAFTIRRFDELLHERFTNQPTIHGYHKRFKVYVIKAFQNGYIKTNPYDAVKIARGKSTSIKYLTEEERDRIETLELSNGMEFSRDLFIFACYTGLAYSDIAAITPADIVIEDGREYIVGSRQKTDSDYKIVVLPKAKELLEKYDYTMNIISNQKANVSLKAIAHMAGIKKNLTMHMGRHTFATWALRKGVNIEIVSKMLAHADISTTQIYAKVLQEEVDKGYDKLL